MKATGDAMLGIGFKTSWSLELKYDISGSGDHAFSRVDGLKAHSWPVIELKLPFQVGQENIATDFFIKLENFIRDNFPQTKISNGVKQENT